jgi:hypothetical protein
MEESQPMCVARPRAVSGDFGDGLNREVRQVFSFSLCELSVLCGSKVAKYEDL